MPGQLRDLVGPDLSAADQVGGQVHRGRVRVGPQLEARDEVLDRLRSQTLLSAKYGDDVCKSMQRADTVGQVNGRTPSQFWVK